MEKNFFPESISIEEQSSTIKKIPQAVSTLEGERISFVEDPTLTFSDTTSTYDVFNSRLFITLVEE